STTPARSCSRPVVTSRNSFSPAAAAAVMARGSPRQCSEAGDEAEHEEADDADADPLEDAVPGTPAGGDRRLRHRLGGRLVRADAMAAVAAELGGGGIGGSTVRTSHGFPPLGQRAQLSKTRAPPAAAPRAETGFRNRLGDHCP